jgi:hypothetical protein
MYPASQVDSETKCNPGASIDFLELEFLWGNVYFIVATMQAGRNDVRREDDAKMDENTLDSLSIVDPK